MKMDSVIVEKEKKVMTMAEYIERDALRDAVESIDWYSVYKGKLTAGAPSSANALYKASSIYAVIDNAPSADVAPVRHGRWVDAYPDIEPNPMFMYGICSECGFEQGISKYLNYCPNCGCRMDGGDDE